MGLLAALLSGQWTPCLGAAVFFEFLWLDRFPAGTYIPPQRILSTLLVCSTAFVLHLSHPYLLLPAMLCALPAAHLGTLVEKRLRQEESENHTQLMNWSDQVQPQGFPVHMIWVSLGRKVLWESGLFFLLALFVTIFTAAAGVLTPLERLTFQFGWPHVWAAALVGSILSVRIRRAYYLLIIGLGLGTVLLFF